jgi:hypothetical protein
MLNIIQKEGIIMNKYDEKGLKNRQIENNNTKGEVLCLNQKLFIMKKRLKIMNWEKNCWKNIKIFPKLK